MLFFKKHISKIIVTTVTIILLIFIGTTKDRDDVSFTERNVGNAISPIQGFFYNIGESISNTFSSITNFSQIKYENKKLKEQIVELKNENRAMLDIISKREFLKNEFILSQKNEYSIIKANVIAKAPGNYFNKFNIDKGSKDGIEKGDIIIYGVQIDGTVVEAGLVGKVDKVSDNWAVVTSIIDPSSNVSFKVIRTQDNGVLSGKKGFDGLSGYMFDIDAEVAEGYDVVTSGLGEVFKKDIYIGTIREVVKETDELRKTIKVEPAVDFKKLNQVFVVKQK